jgi:hypothetical protein
MHSPDSLALASSLCLYGYLSERYNTYMEVDVDVELSKKTTILFSHEQHRLLTRLARERKTSFGELVRSACELEYGTSSLQRRLAAIEELSRLELPVSGVATMKRESVPGTDELLP